MSHNKPQEPNEFQRLNEEWQQKLKDTGFKDIENKNYDLMSFHGTLFNGHKRTQDSTEYMESKLQYFQMASSLLNDYRFKTKLDKTVWTYHAEGKKNTEIFKLLGEKLKLTKINGIVLALKEKMKKKYIK